MANISDMIAEFIDNIIGDDNEVKLSRVELANYFAVAPSQINYVLSTRFTVDKGYIIESKRGGGGCITLVRISPDRTSLLSAILDEIDKTPNLSYNKTQHILMRLNKEGIITDREQELMNVALSDKVLSLPVKMADSLRRNMFKEMLAHLLKE